MRNKIYFGSIQSPQAGCSIFNLCKFLLLYTYYHKIQLLSKNFLCIVPNFNVKKCKSSKKFFKSEYLIFTFFVSFGSIYVGQW